MKTQKLTLMALGVVLNVVCAFVAMSLRLPVYMDSVGTVLIAILLGPKYAVITGLLGSCTSGILFDVYSFYFAPVQITTGFICGVMNQKGMLEGKKAFLGVLIYSLPTAIISALITAYLFGGITSAGSSYLVQVLSGVGVPLIVGVFATQIVTEYVDKFLALIISKNIINKVPKDIKAKI